MLAGTETTSIFSDVIKQGVTGSKKPGSSFKNTHSKRKMEVDSKKTRENKKAVKRRASEDAPNTTEAKIKKMEGSIMKLKEHL